MKVKLIKTGEIREVNDSYGLRLLTQGQAVLAKNTPADKKATEKKTAKAEGDK
ncbi:MAG: hypothetical protein IKK75_07910 [Clostridia bacterium]|nr:hypothetical protein [Clostridia bacterium]